MHPKKRRAPALIKGAIVRQNERFAFLIPEEANLPDLYIDRAHLNGALHGDIVLAAQIPGKTRGEVDKVLVRAAAQLVGTAQNGWLRPDNPNLFEEFFIAPGGADYENGDKVLVRITHYAKSRYEQGIVTVEKVLGKPGAPQVNTLSVLYEKGVPIDFSRDALTQCAMLPDALRAADYAGREDLRNTLLFTIDGADAKDFDDAVSIEETSDGWILGVHIADVSHYVQENDAVDLCAQERGTSVYPPGMVVPMLPEELSNHLCSLIPGRDRLTLSAQIRFDRSGAILEERIFPSVICSKARLTYDKVNQVLGDTADADLLEKHAQVLPALKSMRSLYECLAQRRRDRGSIDFDLPESKLILDDQGRTIDIAREERGISNRMIEEFMLCANGCAARFAMAHKLPFLYRVHESPDPFKIEALQAFVQTFGVDFRFDGAVTPKTLAKLSEKIADTPHASILSAYMLRAMQKARYDAMPLGHFGLATAEYCHFTSPIRRYPDLFIHRVLKDTLSARLDEAAIKSYSRKARSLAQPLSELEERAAQSERMVRSLKMAEYLSHHIGEAFDGTITGVMAFGLFVTLENLIEGLLPAGALSDDRFEHSTRQNALIGQYSRKVYRLGDPIRIRVHSCDPATGHIRFEPATQIPETKECPGRKIKKSTQPKKRRKKATPKSRR